MEAPLILRSTSRRLEHLKRALLVVMSAVHETGAVGTLQDAWEAVLWCALGNVTEAHHRNEDEHLAGWDLAALH